MGQSRIKQGLMLRVDMNRTDIRKLIKSPIATVPTPFDQNHEIDYGRMAELTEMWVD